MPQNDLVIADAPGKPVRLDIQDALQSLATCFAGSTAPTTTYAGQFWLDTSVSPPNGQLRMRNKANTQWIGIAGIPGKATGADILTGVDDTMYVTPKALADFQAGYPQNARNRLFNPAFQINQEYPGDPTISLTANMYPADQWYANSNSASSYVQRVALSTPKLSKYRLRLYHGTTTSGAQSYFAQPIEGAILADFGWGTAAAKRAIARIGVNFPAGTYSFGIRNAALNRSIAFSFTAPDKVDTEFTFAIPPTTTGVFSIDNTLALAIWISPCMVGITPQASGVWTDTGAIVATGQRQDAVAGQTFELFDCGLYIDPLGFGTPPLWEFPDEPTELLRCYRYFVGGVQQYYNGGGVVGPVVVQTNLPASMRVAPTGAGTNVTPTTGFGTTPGTFVAVGASNQCVRENRTGTATGAAQYQTSWNISARM